MLTIQVKGGFTRTFSLKSGDREKALRDAWYAMRGDPICVDKKFKVCTDDGDQFEVKIGDISEIFLEPVDEDEGNDSSSFGGLGKGLDDLLNMFGMKH